ncbi:MAG: MBL fold metallo-hydrolase [Promethearchaeota archaeon]
MILEKIICNFMMTNCYLFGDEKTKEIIIIDPGGEPLAIERRIKNNNYKPKAIIFTHGHPDHTSAAEYLGAAFEIPIMHHSNEQKLINFRDTKYIKEPDVIQIGNENLYVLDTPGHTPGGIILVSYNNKIIFTGDTLFQGSIGRTDLRGGDFNKLMNSIHNKIMHNDKVKEDFIIYPGHMEESTIQAEMEHNLFKDNFL